MKELTDYKELIDYIDKRISELQNLYREKSLYKVNELILVKMKIKQLISHDVSNLFYCKNRENKEPMTCSNQCDFCKEIKKK